MEQDRQRRLMNRRIREVVAVRRMMRSLDTITEEQPTEAA
jgi:hypothetical protein